MRAALAEAVAGVLAGMNTDPITVTDAETDVLLAAADLVNPGPHRRRIRLPRRCD